MSDHTKDCCENNVACDVSNCAYNADGKRCHADHIQVKNTQGTCICRWAQISPWTYLADRGKIM